MGRRVKCQVTHEEGDSSVFFKAPNGKYYKTQEIYNHWRHEVDDRKECINLICEYGNYKIAPTYLNKMVSDFGKRTGYDVLLATIRECENDFQWANDNKDFNNEMGRLFYYKAIIGNHIADVYKRVQLRKEQERKMNSTPIECFVDVDNIGCPTGGGKDLSKLLGEV